MSKRRFPVRHIDHGDDFWDVLVERSCISGDCLIWQGASSKGHPVCSVNGKHTYVHREAYKRGVSKDIDGLDIDHVCHNPMCVNVTHLRAVERRINIINRAGANKNSTTGVRNVQLCPEGKFGVQLKVNRKNVWIGRFDTLEEATIKAREARIVHFGKDAMT